ncbi:MAG: HAD-IA family hydrolase [Gammaproteobacteria bacterium]|nr:HAD-IA family hydrolase [Gammaproteobacteria bacterium]
MIKLIVFDWDGTLMDSEARIVTAMQQAFAAEGAPPPPPAAVREIIGLDLGVAVARLGRDLASRQAAAIVSAYRTLYARLHAVPSPLFDDAEATLAMLDAAGYLLAIATGKSRRGLDRALEESGVGGYFATSRCGEECAPKPDPAMLRDILWDLDTPPAAALMVGDTEFDLLMAQAAGTHAAAVTYGAHPRERLLEHRPALVVDALRDLGAAVDRLNQRIATP